VTARLAPVEGPQRAEAEGDVAGAEAPDGQLHPAVGGGVADPAPSGGAGGDHEDGTDHDAGDGEDANDLTMIHRGVLLRSASGTPTGPGSTIRSTPNGALRGGRPFRDPWYGLSAVGRRTGRRRDP